MNSSPQEKRQFKRISLRIPVCYQIRGTNLLRNAVSQNISAGGICFLDNNFISAKSILMLEFNILNLVLRPIAQVAWVKFLPHSERKEYGLKFLEIEEKEQHFLSEYIKFKST